jgi:hypothetical protein
VATTPLHLLTDSLTVNKAAWDTTDGVPFNDTQTATNVTISVMVQPTSAADSLMYGRDATTQMFDVFCNPLDSTGAAWTIRQNDQVTWNGGTYRVAGKPMDFCSMGVLKKFVMEAYEA